jgi:hypothetical protein
MSLARMAVADRPCPLRRHDTCRRQSACLRIIGGPCQTPLDQGAQRRYHRQPERPGWLRRSKDHLRTKLAQFICEWNQQAHPFNWSTKSVAKVMAEAPARAA